MDTLWVFELPTLTLKQRLQSLILDESVLARQLVCTIQNELAERECHAELTLLLEEEQLQEQQLLHPQLPAPPSAATAAASHVRNHCTPQLQHKLQPQLAPQQLLQQQTSEGPEQRTGQQQQQQQKQQHGMLFYLQQQQQQQHKQGAALQVLPLPHLQPEGPIVLQQEASAQQQQQQQGLTPLQAAQRAFMEEQLRIKQARAALARPAAKAPGRAVLIKQLQVSTSARPEMHCERQLQTGCKQQRCKPDKWHSQQQQQQQSSKPGAQKALGQQVPDQQERHRTTLPSDVVAASASSPASAAPVGGTGLPLEPGCALAVLPHSVTVTSQGVQGAEAVVSSPSTCPIEALIAAVAVEAPNSVTTADSKHTVAGAAASGPMAAAAAVAAAAAAAVGGDGWHRGMVAWGPVASGNGVPEDAVCLDFNHVPVTAACCTADGHTAAAIGSGNGDKADGQWLAAAQDELKQQQVNLTSRCRCESDGSTGNQLVERYLTREGVAAVAAAAVRELVPGVSEQHSEAEQLDSNASISCCGRDATSTDVNPQSCDRRWSVQPPSTVVLLMQPANASSDQPEQQQQLQQQQPALAKQQAQTLAWHRHCYQQQCSKQKATDAGDPSEQQLLPHNWHCTSCEKRKSEEPDQQQLLQLIGNALPPSKLSPGFAGPDADSSCNASSPAVVHSTAPGSVFNSTTGRAGVHQPLQHDCWRDWDVMAGLQDDVFGAWGNDEHG